MVVIQVAAVQIESAVGSVDANVQKIATWAHKAAEAGADLVFFPECCVTGYSVADAKDIALLADDARLSNIDALAGELGMAIGYGFAERDEPSGSLYIAYVISDEKGVRQLVYRKTHLGSRESEVFRQGDDLPVADVIGVRMGVQLCLESHFPDISTTQRAKGAELVIMPHACGAGGSDRIELWDRYLPARAYDNGMFVIACNALRRNAEGDLAGGGMAAYSPAGTCLCSNDCMSEGMLMERVGRFLPRETIDCGMHHISYFDRRRPELYVER